MDIDILTIEQADCLMELIDDAQRIVICSHQTVSLFDSQNVYIHTG